MKVSRVSVVIVEYGKTEKEATDKVEQTMHRIMKDPVEWQMHACIENNVDTAEEGLDDNILEED